MTLVLFFKAILTGINLDATACAAMKMMKMFQLEENTRSLDFPFSNELFLQGLRIIPVFSLHLSL